MGEIELLFESLANRPLSQPGPAAIENFGKALSASLQRQYVSDPANRKREGSLRMSSLGKPAVCSALALPHIKQELKSKLHLAEKNLGVVIKTVQEAKTERNKLTFHLGDWFEAWAAVLLERAGYTHVPIPSNCLSEDAQWRVEVLFPDSLPVVGHLDLVVSRGTEAPLIIEVKTMSDNYWRSFTRLGYRAKSTDDYFFVDGGGDDERGYMTQLALYVGATGYNGAWLALNKATMQLAVVAPDGNDLQAAWARAERVTKALSSIEFLEDVYNKVMAPPGVPEIYKNSPTGRLLLPPAMRYETYAIPEFWYRVRVDKNGYGKETKYIGGYDEDLWGSDPPVSALIENTDYLTYEDIWHG
jgi:5-hydroxyisourate hydrolase-like protein (transthyretin family)